MFERLKVLARYAYMYPDMMLYVLSRYFTTWNILVFIFLSKYFDMIFLCLLVSLVGAYVSYVDPCILTIVFPDGNAVIWDGLPMRLTDILTHHIVLLICLLTQPYNINAFRTMMSILLALGYVTMYDTNAIYGIDNFELFLVGAAVLAIRTLFTS